MKQLYLITGFLGAGKTTFVNTAVKTFEGKRIAVIVNEFGKQGIDGVLLSDNGYEVTEISNGSVFCVCRMDMFIDALTEAAKSSADILLVETSGLSNPSNIDDILTQTRKVSNESYDYRGCICLVDAVNFEKVYETAIVIPDQIKQASLVVINKTDLADKQKIEKIQSLVRSINPACEIYKTTYANIPKTLLAGLQNHSDRVMGGKQDILSGSLTFEVLNKPTLQSFQSLLDGLKSIVYRCKGYAALSDGTYFIDGVMDEITVSSANSTHKNAIVLLYKTSGKVRKTLQRAAEENGIKIKLIS